MKTLYFPFLTCFLFFINSLPAQEFKTDYKSIAAKGSIPSVVNISLDSKIQAEVKRQEKKTGKKKLKKELAIGTHADIQELFKSGSVLFNDTISRHVNKVGNNIRKADPGLKDVQIYVLRSVEVNAFCFGNGMIFIDLGLLAKLENEAQLAYILSHEMIHFKKQHSLQRIVEFDRIQKQNSRKKTFEEKVLLMYKYSKENETEADTAGLSLYLAAGYPVAEAVKALDVLKNSEAPFQETLFPKEFFESAVYHFPQKYLNEERNEHQTTDFNDSYQTHPNMVSRKSMVEGLSINRKENVLIPTDTSEFNHIREISRFECCNLFLVERDYLNAFKWSVCLLNQYPDNIYLRRILSKSLYALSLFKSGHLKYGAGSVHDNAIPDHSRIEDPSSQVNYFFAQIPENELSILSTRYLWINRIKFSTDEWFRTTADTALQQILSNDISKQLILKKDAVTQEQNYYVSAFTDLLADTTAEFYSAVKKYNTGTTNFVESSFKTFSFGDTKKKKGQIIETPLKPGDGILLMEPDYSYTSDKKDFGKNILVAEKKKDQLFKLIQAECLLNNIQGRAMPSDSLNKIEEYNELYKLNSYLNERVDAGLENLNPILGSDNNEILNTDASKKFCMLVSVKSHETKESMGYKAMILYAWGWLVFPIPIIAYQVHHPPKTIDINISLIDLRTGALVKNASKSGTYRNAGRRVKKTVKNFIKEL